MAGNITRSLLGYLALAGPCYVGVSVVQALTRRGFSLVHDEWSLLALGHLGGIQVANLVLTGAMTVAGAVGVHRAGTAGSWPPRLLAGYGLGLIAAGIFRADPARGFPPGTPSGPAAHASWQGTVHLVSGAVGFACLIAVCFLLGRVYARRARPTAARAARTVGVLFAAAFAGIASGSSSVAVNLGFTAAVVISSAWLTVVAVDMYRGTRQVAAR